MYLLLPGIHPARMLNNKTALINQYHPDSDKVLVDECAPKALKAFLSDLTVEEAGWARTEWTFIEPWLLLQE